MKTCARYLALLSRVSNSGWRILGSSWRSFAQGALKNGFDQAGLPLEFLALVGFAIFTCSCSRPFSPEDLYSADGTVVDSGEGHRDGVLGADVSYTRGRVGSGAFSFPGNDTAPGKNAVQLSNSDSLGTGTEGLDISVLVRFSKLESASYGGCPNGQQYIVCKQNSRSYADGFALCYALVKRADNRLAFTLDFGPSDEKAAVSTTKVVADRWYSIVASYRKHSIDLYVNGVLEGSVPETRDLDAAATPVYFGRTNSSTYDGLFNGMLDEATFFSHQEVGLVASYDGDELTSWWAAEDNANDSQGSNHGTLVGGITFSAGKVGNAFNLDGSSAYIRVPHSPDLNPTRGFTLDAWIMPTRDGTQAIISKWGNPEDWGGQQAYYLRTEPDLRLGFYMSDDAHQGDDSFKQLLTPANAITLNAWHHVAAVFDQTTGTRRIYVDGVEKASRIDPAPNPAQPQPPISVTQSQADLSIGASQVSSTTAIEFFQGEIDEVDMFNRPLPASEIQAIFTSDATGKSRQPSVSITDAEALANSAGDSTATFAINVARPTNAAITQLEHEALERTAMNGVDYSSPDWPADFTIGAGVQRVTFNMTVAANANPAPGALFSERLMFGPHYGDPNAVINRTFGNARILTGNAVSDFSPTTNTTDQMWQYGYTFPSGVGFTNYPIRKSFNGAPVRDDEVAWGSLWRKPGDDMSLLFNGSGKIQHYNAYTDQPADMMAMFPSGTGSKTVLRWKAPATSAYYVTGVFQGIDYASSDVTIVKNSDWDHPLLFNAGDPPGGIYYINGKGDRKSFSFTVNVNADNTLDFRVGPNGSNAYDGTGLAVSIIPGAGSNGLVAYYKAEENPNDESRGVHDGRPVGNPGYDTGAVGEAFKFDGATQYVRVPSSWELNPARSLTVAAWIYPTSDGDHAIVSKWGDQGDYSNQRVFNLMAVPNRKVNFAISDDAHQGDSSFHTFMTDANAIALNTWNHVVAVYDQVTGTRRIYVNGVEKASRTDAPIMMSATDADIGIGAIQRSSTSADYFFPGRIDDVKIFNRALSAAEVAAMSVRLAITGDFPLDGQLLTFEGGTGPYTVSVVSGSLPAGVSISNTGVVTGSLGSGAYSFTLRVTDSTGATADRTFTSLVVPVPTNVVANIYHSPGDRASCFTLATDGIVNASDAGCFDTWYGSDPFQFAGLLYLETPGSGHATRFDSVRIDMGALFGDGGEFAQTPQLYLLRHNSDPNTFYPGTDDRYVFVPIAPSKSTNSAGRPAYVFDLSSLPPSARVGYGFAVVGPGAGSNRFISIAEMSATVVQVAAPPAPVPSFWEYNGHRYGLTFTRGTWPECEAEAVALGGHLVAINSAEENDFLRNTFGFAQEDYFIGLRQNNSSPNTEPRGGWYWVGAGANGADIPVTNADGTDVPGVYSNWQPGEPNNYLGAGEDYAMLAGRYFNTPTTGTWGDCRLYGYPETSNYRGIIELPSASGTPNFQLLVQGTSNIYGAGQANTTPSVDGAGGTPPVCIDLPNGATNLSFSSVNGFVNIDPSTWTTIKPDGLTGYPTSVAANSGYNGHAGIIDGNSGGFLTGVFVDDDGAVPVVPSALDFSSTALREDFASLSPQLNQPFFIGDGYTGTGWGPQQQFVVPTGAKRLYLGIVDSWDGTHPFLNSTSVGFYSDNSGSFNARFFCSGIVASYPAEDSAADATANHHDGTLGGGVAYAAGRIGKGFYFPGADSDLAVGRNAVEIPDGADLKPSNITVSAWVKFSNLSSATVGATSGQQYIVCKQNSRSFADGWALDYALLKTADNHLWFGSDFGVSQEVAAISSATVVGDTWYHVVGTYDHQNFKIYMNGKLEGTAAETQHRDLLHSAPPLYLGRTNSNLFDALFRGVMDDVQIYNCALTDSEVAAIDEVWITNTTFPFTGGQLTFSGDTGAYNVSVVSGSLPPGISLSPSGAVTGLAAVGPYSFTLRVTNVLGVSADRTFTGTVPQPTATNLVANIYHSPADRAGCFALATDGIVDASEPNGFDTWSSSNAFQFAGLLYLESSGSGLATRFDSVRVDMGTVFGDGGEFSQTPQLFLLRHNSDPDTSYPGTDDRYAFLPIAPVKSTNNAGRPAYVFDLTALPASSRTGYGFAVVGPGSGSAHFISISELKATTARVTAPSAVQPTWVEFNGHRYAPTFAKGTWEQCEAEAQSYGGHLVTFTESEQAAFNAEHDFVLRTFGSEPIYIGMKRTSGVLGWVTGEPITSTKWAPGNPAGPTEEYVVLNYWAQDYGLWHDVFPQDATNFRGIIELPTPSTGTPNFRLIVPATSNIFGAGQANTTPSTGGGGGTAPVWIDLPGGASSVSFSAVTCYLGSPPYIDVIADGTSVFTTSIAPTNGCNGLAGIVNGNGASFLTGVFVDDDGAVTPLPPALDFSNSALRQDFTTLSPQLNQPFFVGDGYSGKGAGTQQHFTVPAGATRLYLGVADASDGTPFHNPAGAGSYGDNTGFLNVKLSATITLAITNTNFPTNGGQLTFVGGSGSYAVSVVSGSLPPGLSLSPSGLVTGTAASGAYNFTLRVTDTTTNATADRTFSGVLSNSVSVPPNIIAWWPAEGATGDVIGNHHATLQNGATFASGNVGRAFYLDGTDDYVTTPDSPDWDLGANDFTIEGWINTATPNVPMRLISAGSVPDGPNNLWTFGYGRLDGPWGTDGRNHLNFAYYNGGGFSDFNSDGITIDQGKWHHIALTRTGTTLTFYFDGVAHGSSNIGTVAINGGSTGAIVGARYHGSTSNIIEFANGKIDEVSLYSRALTAGEISGIYSALTSGKTRYDAVRDFSRTQNPGAAWSYRWLPGDASMSTYDPTAADPPPPASRLLPTPTGPDGNGILGYGGPSYITLNTTDNFIAINTSGQYDWAPRQLGMGPGPGSEFAVLRWKAPQSGTYAVSGTFFGCDTRPTSADVHIFHNANQLTPADKRYVNSYRGDGVSHTQVITVAANDTVDFVLGAGGNGYGYDSSGLAASVTPLTVTAGSNIVIEQPAGTAIGSDVTVAFGSSSIGVEVNKTFVIKNTGTQDLHLTSPPITIDGSNYLDFFWDGPAVTMLTPGTSTTFTATFYPLATGPRTAVLHVASDATSSNPFNITLTGTGVSGSPHIAVEQPAGTGLTSNGGAIDFGSNAVGGASLRTFVIKNTGNAVLTGVGATIDGANYGDFAVTANPPASITPGQAPAPTFTVRFMGTAVGSRSAMLHIASNDSARNPFNVPLTGTATSATVDATFNAATDVPVTADGFNAAGVTLNPTLNFAPAFGTSLTIVNNTGSTAVTGAFNGRAQGSTVSMSFGGHTYDFILTYSGGTGNDIVLLWPGSGAVAWGDNVSGRIGDGTTGGNKTSPVNVLATGALAGKSVIAVAAGLYHSLALTSDGKVFAWGQNDVGQLGDNSSTNSNVPVSVDTNGVLAGKTVAAISAGLNYSVALTSDGLVFTWGQNGGTLGNGASTLSRVPVAVDTSGALAGKFVTCVSAGWYHVLARTSDGRVFGWGNNGFGQLGTGNTTTTLSPVAMDVTSIINSGKTVKSVSAGYVHSLILTADNIVFTCGDNYAHELGLGASNSAYPFSTSLVVPSIGALGLSGGSITSVTAGVYESFAITTAGKVISWGGSGLGGNGLGVANATDHSGDSPVYVDASGVLQGKFITSVSAGSTYAVALSSDGQAFAWGSAQNGQLGNGATVNSMTPVAVDSTGILDERKVLSIASGANGPLAVATVTPLPSMLVQKPGGVSVSSGSKLDLGTALPGNTTTLTVTIGNTGSGKLKNLAVSKNGTDPGEFTIGSLGATTVAANGSTTFTITFAPTLSVAREAAVHITSNDGEHNPFDLPLIGTGGIPITTWRQGIFGTSANSGNAADDADPDHDGVNNLLEFATTGDPNTSDSPPGSQVTSPPANGNTMEFFYTRNKQAMAELTFQVEWNDVLSSTGWSSVGVTEVILTDDGITQQVKALVPTGGNDHRFVHLKVTRP